MEDIVQLPDLGEGVVIRREQSIGTSGVIQLTTDTDSSRYMEAMEEIRDVLEKHYGHRFADVVDDDEQMVIDRFVARSDDVPYIEYQTVDSYE